MLKETERKTENKFSRSRLRPKFLSRDQTGRETLISLRRTREVTYLHSSGECRTRRMRWWRMRDSVMASRRSMSVTISRRFGLCSLSASRFSNMNTDASCQSINRTTLSHPELATGRVYPRAGPGRLGSGRSLKWQNSAGRRIELVKFSLIQLLRFILHKPPLECGRFCDTMIGKRRRAVVISSVIRSRVIPILCVNSGDTSLTTTHAHVQGGPKSGPSFSQILTDLEFFWLEDSLVNLQLNGYLKSQRTLHMSATLPCELSPKQAINDKLQGSVAAYLRPGGVVNNPIKKVSCWVSERNFFNWWIFGKVTSNNVIVSCTVFVF